MTVKDCGAYMMIYMIWQIGRKIILVCQDVFFSINIWIISGGRDWLVLTKGTDCTEAFETFHVFGVSSTVLHKFWVKKANTPRRYRYVIHNFFIGLVYWPQFKVHIQEGWILQNTARQSCKGSERSGNRPRLAFFNNTRLPFWRFCPLLPLALLCTHLSECPSSR